MINLSLIIVLSMSIHEGVQDVEGGQTVVEPVVG